MTEHEKAARELFYSGTNCAQAVFTAFCDRTGLSQDMALRLSGGLGAGMGKLRETCGALSGAVMVYGLLKGYGAIADPEENRRQKSALYKSVRLLAQRFKEAQGGTYNCRAILGLKEGEDPVEPAVRTPEYYASRPCLGCVGCAARLLDEMLDESDQ